MLKTLGFDVYGMDIDQKVVSIAKNEESRMSELVHMKISQSMITDSLM